MTSRSLKLYAVLSDGFSDGDLLEVKVRKATTDWKEAVRELDVPELVNGERTFPVGIAVLETAFNPDIQEYISSDEARTIVDN